MRQQVRLCDEDEVGLSEHHRVLQGLVFPLGHREGDDVERLAEVVDSRTDQVADVFDKEQPRVPEALVMERVMNHRGVEVARGTGGDRPRRDTCAAQAVGIALGFEIARDGGHAESPGEGGAGFHAQWDANFVHPVREVVTLMHDEHRSMEVVSSAIAFSYDGDAFRRVIYSESHDEVANGKARVPQEINPGDPGGWHAQKRSTLAAGLVFTSPGIPMLFQGQEFLQGEWFRDDVPLDWELNEQYRGIVRLYRDLVGLRLNRQGHSRGLCGQFLNIYHVNRAENVIAFQRWDQHGAGDDVVVVLSFSHAPRENYDLGMPAPGLWKLRLNTDAAVYSHDFQGFFSGDIEAYEGGRDGLDAHGSLSIGPYSMLIFSQDK